ncbi:hypothetical protein HDU85_006775 [Gaertneriomyces sp. JEL0708]|nr:hypothetical protein HDU85_006775 [Gaertneriomyces sp. JEL0708]
MQFSHLDLGVDLLDVVYRIRDSAAGPVLALLTERLRPIIKTGKSTVNHNDTVEKAAETVQVLTHCLGGDLPCSEAYNWCVTLLHAIPAWSKEQGILNVIPGAPVKDGFAKLIARQTKDLLTRRLLELLEQTLNLSAIGRSELRKFRSPFDDFLGFMFDYLSERAPASLTASFVHLVDVYMTMAMMKADAPIRKQQWRKFVLSYLMTIPLINDNVVRYHLREILADLEQRDLFTACCFEAHAHEASEYRVPQRPYQRVQRVAATWLSYIVRFPTEAVTLHYDQIFMLLEKVVIADVDPERLNVPKKVCNSVKTAAEAALDLSLQHLEESVLLSYQPAPATFSPNLALECFRPRLSELCRSLCNRIPKGGKSIRNVSILLQLCTMQFGPEVARQIMRILILEAPLADAVQDPAVIALRMMLQRVDDQILVMTVDQVLKASSTLPDDLAATALRNIDALAQNTNDAPILSNTLIRHWTSVVETAKKCASTSTGSVALSLLTSILEVTEKEPAQRHNTAIVTDLFEILDIVCHKQLAATPTTYVTFASSITLLKRMIVRVAGFAYGMTLFSDLLLNLCWKLPWTIPPKSMTVHAKRLAPASYDLPRPGTTQNSLLDALKGAHANSEEPPRKKVKREDAEISSPDTAQQPITETGISSNRRDLLQILELAIGASNEEKDMEATRSVFTKQFLGRFAHLPVTPPEHYSAVLPRLVISPRDTGVSRAFKERPILWDLLRVTSLTYTSFIQTMDVLRPLLATSIGFWNQPMHKDQTKYPYEVDAAVKLIGILSPVRDLNGMHIKRLGYKLNVFFSHLLQPDLAKPVPIFSTPSSAEAARIPVEPLKRDEIVGLPVMLDKLRRIAKKNVDTVADFIGVILADGRE